MLQLSLLSKQVPRVMPPAMGFSWDKTRNLQVCVMPVQPLV